MKLLIRPGKHRYRTVPKLGRLRELLCAMWEKFVRRGKCHTVWTQEYIHHIHLCLLLLQSSSLQNPMFCRLPQELKFCSKCVYIILGSPKKISSIVPIILFIYIFVIPSPLISYLYSNLENDAFAHFCQLCSRFCQDEWLQLFK